MAITKRAVCLKYLLLLLCFLCTVLTVLNEVMDPCSFTVSGGIQFLSSRINCYLEENFEDKGLYADVEVVGIDQITSRAQGKGKYLLILPRETSCSSCSEKLCNNVSHLLDILESWSDFDGASCAGQPDTSNTITTCTFFTQHWSMVLHEGDKLHARDINQQSVLFFNCTIFETPFLIRRDVFNKLGFRPSHGEATLLDFFLRSKGALKFASSLNCTFSNDQMVVNRGAMKTKEVYLDYGLLGFNHNILRIIRKDSITWTQCTRNEYYCPNKPLQEISNPISKQLSLFCCDVALNQFLIDAVDGLNEVGLDYRLCYGTLLGAVRSRNIIPWTRDIDIDLTPKDYRDSYSFDRLKHVMQKKHYSTPLIYELRRIIPLFPFKIKLLNLFSYDLFNKEILEMMKDVLPITTPEWNSMGYVDIYPYEGVQTASTNITINGRKYKTHSNPEHYLNKVFGKSWRQVQHSFKSKDPHKPWIWQLDTSRVQEDFPKLKSYCGIHHTYTIVFLIIVALLIAVHTCVLICWNVIRTVKKICCSQLL